MMGTVKSAWRMLSPDERRSGILALMLMAVAGMFAAGMIGSILPFLTVMTDPSRIETVPALAWAYQRFGFTSDYVFLWALGLASLGMIILSNLVQLLNQIVMVRYTQRCGHSLSNNLLRAYLSQPYVYHLDRHSGDLGAQILSEAQSVIDRFFQPLSQVITSSCSAVMISTLLFVVNPGVTVGALGVVAGSFCLLFGVLRRRLSSYGRVRAQANKERFRIANEALTGIKLVKLEGRESDYLTAFRTPTQQIERTIVKAHLASSLPGSLLQIIVFGGLILVCLFLMTAEGLASGSGLGDILPLIGLFAFAGQRLLPEISAIYRSLVVMRFGAASVEAVERDLALGHTLADTDGQVPALTLCNELSLRNVSYHYAPGSEAGLTDVTLTIRAGERLGIVGGTGAGKTTLVDIILGLLQPQSGTITIDDLALTPDRLRAWQRGLAYVPQEAVLIDASIADNIARGNYHDQIDQNKLRHAAEVAHLTDFVNDLPEGFATFVGERGVRLSGGQRQRIALARAIYRDAQILILDEATSALDNLTEREVIAAIDNLPGDKTVLIIAHRLTTVQGCDRIVVMDRGRIAETGPVAELSSRDGLFARMLNVNA